MLVIPSTCLHFQNIYVCVTTLQYTLEQRLAYRKTILHRILVNHCCTFTDLNISSGKKESLRIKLVKRLKRANPATAIP